MSKPRITGKLALKLLEEVVADVGAGYVYPYDYCVYVLDGAPACIVGHALVRGGVSCEILEELRVYSVDSSAVREMVPITDKALRILQAAQIAQDGEAGLPSSRKTWGEALQAAKEAAK